jgi:hypothetical protein
MEDTGREEGSSSSANVSCAGRGTVSVGGE